MRTRGRAGLVGPGRPIPGWRRAPAGRLSGASRARAVRVAVFPRSGPPRPRGPPRPVTIISRQRNPPRVRWDNHDPLVVGSGEGAGAAGQGRGRGRRVSPRGRLGEASTPLPAVLVYFHRVSVRSWGGVPCTHAVIARPRSSPTQVFSVWGLLNPVTRALTRSRCLSFRHPRSRGRGRL